MSVFFLLTAGLFVVPVGGGSATLLAQAPDTLRRYVGRSPGERGVTDILKGAYHRVDPTSAASAGGEPTQRALGKIFDTPPEDALRQLGLSPLDALAPIGNIADGLAPPGDPAITPASYSSFPTPASSILPASGSPLSGGGSTPGGGGTIPDNGGGTPGGGDPQQPVGAVPEPATWAMMVIGFAFCGVALRRRKRAARAETAYLPVAPPCGHIPGNASECARG